MRVKGEITFECQTAVDHCHCEEQVVNGHPHRACCMCGHRQVRRANMPPPIDALAGLKAQGQEGREARAHTFTSPQE